MIVIGRRLIKMIYDMAELVKWRFQTLPIHVKFVFEATFYQNLNPMEESDQVFMYRFEVNLNR